MPRSLPGPVMALPWTRASPVVGSSKPAIMRSSVDFPQPEAPIRQTNSPCGIVRSIGASASTSSSSTAKRLVTPRMVRMLGDGSSLKVLRTPAQEAITDRDEDPGETMRNPQSVEDGRQRRGKDDFAKHCRAGTAQHGSRLEQSRIDRAHAKCRVQQDRIKRAEEHQEDRRIRS